MRRVIFRTFLASAVLCLGFVLVFFAIAGQAYPQEVNGSTHAQGRQQAQPRQLPCAPAKAVRGHLLEKYGETQRSLGLVAKGAGVLEIYSDPEGSWSAVLTGTNGIACIIAAGKYWTDVPPKPSGPEA